MGAFAAAFILEERIVTRTISVPAAEPRPTGASARLLRQGQRRLAREFPATIKIGHQTYACATSGIQRSETMVEGGFEAARRIAFWLPVQAFVTAGAILPRSKQPLVCTAPQQHAGAWKIETVTVDAASANIVLQCEEQPQ